MVSSSLALILCSVLWGPSTAGGGSIRGTVVNGSRGEAPAGETEVVLRVKVDGQFVTAAETITDARGRFVFRPLPVRSDLQYLPGANRAGVHYPGKRIRLRPERPRVDVRLRVYDAVAKPNPLVARRHEIFVRPEPGALEVTERIVVANPTSTCYVGQAVGQGKGPLTLQLAIPPEFDRTTFHREFYGRRFSLIDGKLVTGIPWPPGARELKFTYLLRNQDKHRVWQRPLDLPCSQLRVCVSGGKPEEVSCNLGRAPDQQPGQAVFESSGPALPAGHVVRLELGQLPVPWTAYGRWVALAALVGLIAGTGAMMIRRRRPQNGHLQSAGSASRPVGPSKGLSQRPGREGRRARKRDASAPPLR